MTVARPGWYCFLFLFVIINSFIQCNVFVGFYSAPQCSHCKRCPSYSNSVCLSVCLSVRLSHASIVSKRLHVARCSLHCQFAKCVYFCSHQKYFPGTTPSPEILVQTLLPPPDSSKSWHVLPSSASTVKDRKRCSITVNKMSTRTFQQATSQGFAPPLTSSKWGTIT